MTVAENDEGATHFYGDGCDAAHGRSTCCQYCGEDVPELTEYQSHVGRTWRGHKDCVEEESARWVLVQKEDVQVILAGKQEVGSVAIWRSAERRLGEAIS